MEYALGLGLFVLAVSGGLQLVQSAAEDELAADQAAIAETEHFGTVASTTSTPATVPGPTTTASTTTSLATTTTTTLGPTTTTTVGPTTTTAPAAPPVLSATCSGRSCTFTVTGAPAGATYAWTRGSTPVQNGPSPTWSYAPGNNGATSYNVVVTVSPGSTTHSATVTCAGGGGRCTPTVTSP